MIKCGECGYENMDGLDYCDGCGAKLAAGAAAAPAAAPAAAAPEAAPAAAPAESSDASAAPAAAAEAEAPAAEVPKSEAPTGEIKPEAAPESAPSAPTAAAAGAPFKAKLSCRSRWTQGPGISARRRQQPGRPMGSRDRIVSGSRSRRRRSRSQDLAQACVDSNRRRQDHDRGHRQSQRHLRQSSAAPLAGQPRRDQVGRRGDHRQNVPQAGGRNDILTAIPSSRAGTCAACAEVEEGHRQSP